MEASKKRKKRHRVPAADRVAGVADRNIEADSFGEVFDFIDESQQGGEEERLLIDDISGQLERLSHGPKDEESKAMLAELTVCMLIAKKRPSEVTKELESFLGEHSPEFVQWLSGHVQGPWLQTLRTLAGATPKAAARGARSK